MTLSVDDSPLYADQAVCRPAEAKYNDLCSRVMELEDRIEYLEWANNEIIDYVVSREAFLENRVIQEVRSSLASVTLIILGSAILLRCKVN